MSVILIYSVWKVRLKFLSMDDNNAAVPDFDNFSPNIYVPVNLNFFFVKSLSIISENHEATNMSKDFKPQYWPTF